MAWQDINTLDMPQAFACILHHIDMVDLERNLCLSTTRGRTRNGRRWFVHFYDPVKCTTNGWDKVVFRAWTLEEAIERLSEPRIVNRINKMIEGRVAQPPES